MFKVVEVPSSPKVNIDLDVVGRLMVGIVGVVDRLVLVMFRCVAFSTLSMNKYGRGSKIRAARSCPAQMGTSFSFRVISMTAFTFKRSLVVIHGLE